MDGGRERRHEAGRGEWRCVLGQGLLPAQLARVECRLVHEVDGARRGQLLCSAVPCRVRLISASGGLPGDGHAQGEVQLAGRATQTAAVQRSQ